MKISEAQRIYRGYGQALYEQTKNLEKQKAEAEKQFRLTGKSEFSEQAATLQLSIEASQDMYEKNQKVLGNITEQYTAAWNAEVSRQQADAVEEEAAEYSKILEVARRISRGDKVPAYDERKLMEYSDKLYQAAKSAAMLHEMEKKRKEHKSLWKEEDEENRKEYDPQKAAENAEFAGNLPDIEIPETVDEEVSS